MAGIGFKERATAESLKAMLLPGQASRRVELGKVTEGYILRTPSGGIPAFVGIKAGKAECTVYYINNDDDVVPFLDKTGASFTLWVWNLAEVAVAGSVNIQAKKVFGKLTVDWENCGE